MTSSIILEVCLTSVDDAIAAHRAGADRIEINTALSLGGLTPSPEMLRAVKSAIPIPVITMIRPRPGGFCYSDFDFEVMRIDTQWALQYGSDGIAFGVLKPDGEIDAERCRDLRTLIGERQAVFHRGFDVTPDPFRALEQLIDIGFTRVMTSGQQETARKGSNVIRQLIERARGRIEVLPAGGIRASNVRELIASTGCVQVHGSFCEKRAAVPARSRPNNHFGAIGDEGRGTSDATNFDAVAAARAVLDEPVGEKMK